MNSNQTAGLTDDCDDEMVGKLVSGVIEGTFNDGYLLNVQITETDIHLRGLVFLPGRVAPITAENDVAPHLRMIRRREIPMPVPNPETQMHTSVPPSGQSSKTPVELESQVPTFKDQVLPTELHSGIPVSLDSQSGSGMVPKTDSPKIDTVISTQGIPQGISVSLGNQPGPSILPTANLSTVDTAISTGGIPQGISLSLDNLSGSGTVPTTDSPKIDTSISTQGIPQGISVSLGNAPGPFILPAANLSTVDTAISTGRIPQGISFSLDNLPGSGMIPKTDSPKIDTPISTQGIPQRILVSLGSQPGPSILPAANLPTVNTAISTGGIPQGISFSLDNQSGSDIVPAAYLLNNETANFTGGIPHGISDPEHESQSVPEMECENTRMQERSMHEVDAIKQVKEPFADGGATKHLEAPSEPINLEHKSTQKQQSTVEQAETSVHKLNELIHEETENLNIGVSHAPVSVEPQSFPSEQVTKPVDSSEEKQPSPKSADSSEKEQASPKSDLQDTKTEHTTETSSENLTLNSNGRSSTHVANAFDLESDPVPEAAPSESKFVSKTSDSPRMRDPQNFPSSSAVTDEKDNVQPTDTSARSETPYDQTIPETDN